LDILTGDGSWRYDPFGTPVTVSSAITNNQRLPGQWFQIEDGLSYNWHRTYDPGLGRYTQPDPLGFVDGPNVYGYAGQIPVMRVDPRGEFVQVLIGFGLGIGFEYLTNPCATWQDYALAGGLGALGGGAAGKIGGKLLPKLLPNGIYKPLFKPNGLLNSNRYLRIGEGDKGGNRVFRIGGNWVKIVKKNGKIDLKDLGPK
jgi:RHS repeat-associated protein